MGQHWEVTVATRLREARRGIAASRQGKASLLLLLCALVAGMLMVIPSAVAVHDFAGGMQLDGDIAVASDGQCGETGVPAPPCDGDNAVDWDSLFQQGSTTDANNTSGTPGG